MTTLRMKLLISCSSWGPNASNSPAVTSTQPTAARYLPGSGTNPSSFRGNTLAKRTNSNAWEGWEGSEAALSLRLGEMQPLQCVCSALPCPILQGDQPWILNNSTTHPKGISPAPQVTQPCTPVGSALRSKGFWLTHNERLSLVPKVLHPEPL